MWEHDVYARWKYVHKHFSLNRSQRFMVRKPQSIYKHTLYLLLLLAFVVFVDWSGIFGFQATKLPFHIDRTLCTDCSRIKTLLIDLLQNQTRRQQPKPFYCEIIKLDVTEIVIEFWVSFLWVWSFGSNNWFSMCGRRLECLKHTQFVIYAGNLKHETQSDFGFFFLFPQPFYHVNPNTLNDYTDILLQSRWH